jgi:hypothetical protein
VFVDVDSGHIYWTTGGGNSIGRADLKGQNASTSFITDTFATFGLTVASGHVYWTDTNGQVSRADLSGQNITLDFIPGVVAFELAVDGS